MNPFTMLGKSALYIVNTLGSLAIMLIQCVKWLFRRPFRFRLLVLQMENIGVNSLPIVVMTGIFTGMVFAYQVYYGFHTFGAEAMTGMVVTFAMARELGPVLGSIMVTARCGSAMAAEIGTMQVTEQVDALHALAVDPIQYLVLPRVLAGFIMMPILNLVTVVASMVGAYVVAVKILGVNSTLYIQNIVSFVDMNDMLNGVMKAAVFGILLTLVGCCKGYSTSGGAMGVGKATTEAVVLSCVLILSMDYVLTTLTM